MSRLSCTGCNLARIQGVVCHETGCPEAWRSETRSCGFCGQDFKPERRWQKTCGHSCNVAYNGETCDCTECHEDFGEQETGLFAMANASGRGW